MTCSTSYRNSYQALDSFAQAVRESGQATHRERQILQLAQLQASNQYRNSQKVRILEQALIQASYDHNGSGPGFRPQ